MSVRDGWRTVSAVPGTLPGSIGEWTFGPLSVRKSFTGIFYGPGTGKGLLGMSVGRLSGRVPPTRTLVTHGPLGAPPGTRTYPTHLTDL